MRMTYGHLPPPVVDVLDIIPVQSCNDNNKTEFGHKNRFLFPCFSSFLLNFFHSLIAHIKPSASYILYYYTLLIRRVRLRFQVYNNTIYEQ